MSEDKSIRELLAQTGIGQTEIAKWLDCSPRTIRHYVKGRENAALALLLAYCADRPEAVAWFRARQATREASERAKASKAEQGKGDSPPPATAQL